MAVNMTSQSIAVGDNWVKVGNDYVGSSPNGATNGGTAALGWSAPSGLADGNTLTITTDGTNPFGATGPEIVMLMDAADYALGQADGSEIRQGPAAVLVEGGTFTVEADSILPAGKGWQMGLGAEFDRVKCDHNPSTRIFDSQTYYYSAQNIENSRALVGSGNQMKPVWNQVNSGPDGQTWGGDFFTTRPCVNVLSGADRRPKSYISSNSVPTEYFANDPVDNPSDANNYPYPVPYTMENLWDQGSADGVTLDGSLDYFCTASNGLASSRATPTGLLLSSNSYDNKIINYFTYSSYFLGLDIAEDNHLLDCEYYRAIGDGAACRVAITNHADYFQASKRTILWTNSWANGAISAEIRDGWFDLTNTSGLYVNVINANNAQIGSIAL